MTTEQQNSGRPITGRTVLFGMLAFFGVIIAVNMLFVYFALESWPGLSTDKAYEDGLAYNKTLEAAARQSELGWQSRVGLENGAQLSAMLLNKSGAGVSGGTVTARLVRPTHEGIDQTIMLKEFQPGHYLGPVSPLLPGRWKVELRVTEGEQSLYFMVHELRVK